jgi:hypothetical protein
LLRNIRIAIVPYKVQMLKESFFYF